MTNSSILNDSVVKGYLNGKTFREISIENTISVGKVSTTIKSWKDKMNIPDIEELRSFSRIIRKSGITIEQCTQAFRFIQILSNFGITDDPDFDSDDNNKTSHSQDPTKLKESKMTNKATFRNNFYNFIDNLYNNCRNYNVHPPFIVKWIEDLLEFKYTDDTDYESSYSTSSMSNNVRSESPDDNDEHISKEESRSKNIGTIKNKPNQIIFISQISNYIEYQKLELRKQIDDKKKVIQEIKNIEKQKAILTNKITKVKEENVLAFLYLQWFKKLRKELSDNYNLFLEFEIKGFVNAINDFRNYGYNSYELIKEYKEIKTLREENDSILNEIHIKKSNKENLTTEISSLEDKISYSKQAYAEFNKLIIMGFGFKELNQLSKTITEISVVNDIRLEEAIKKFIKDIEENYDSRLGYEKKVNEIKEEMEKLKSDLPNYKENLQSQYSAKIVLDFLALNGVTHDDIIGINNLLNSYKRGEIVFDISSHVSNKESSPQVLKPSNTINIWQSLIQELRNLGNINQQIVTQISNLNKINEEIDRLNSQRENLNQQTLETEKIFNTIQTQILNYIEQLKEIIKLPESNTKIIVHLPLFYIYIVNKDNLDDKSKEDQNQDS